MSTETSRNTVIGVMNRYGNLIPDDLKTSMAHEVIEALVDNEIMEQDDQPNFVGDTIDKATAEQTLADVAAEKAKIEKEMENMKPIPNLAHPKPAAERITKSDKIHMDEFFEDKNTKRKETKSKTKNRPADKKIQDNVKKSAAPATAKVTKLQETTQVEEVVKEVTPKNKWLNFMEAGHKQTLEHEEFSTMQTTLFTLAKDSDGKNPGVSDTLWNNVVNKYRVEESDIALESEPTEPTKSDTGIGGLSNLG